MLTSSIYPDFLSGFSSIAFDRPRSTTGQWCYLIHSWVHHNKTDKICLTEDNTGTWENPSVRKSSKENWVKTIRNCLFYVDVTDIFVLGIYIVFLRVIRCLKVVVLLMFTSWTPMLSRVRHWLVAVCARGSLSLWIDVG